MKRLLLLFAFFTPLVSSGQITNDKLIGTWQLIEYQTPLSAVSYADINSIEFLGDAEAIKRFGMNGLYGVLIIDLREGKLQPLMQTLKTSRP